MKLKFKIHFLILGVSIIPTVIIMLSLMPRLVSEGITGDEVKRIIILTAVNILIVVLIAQTICRFIYKEIFKDISLFKDIFIKIGNLDFSYDVEKTSVDFDELRVSALVLRENLLKLSLTISKATMQIDERLQSYFVDYNSLVVNLTRLAEEFESDVPDLSKIEEYQRMTKDTIRSLIIDTEKIKNSNDIISEEVNKIKI